MPGGNGQTASKRKHGVYFSRFGLVCSVLLALCCLEAPGSMGHSRPCAPCPANCTCALQGAQAACVVNCSNLGLDRGPAAAELPSDTNTLDLSRNHISSVEADLFDRLTSLKELYLQGNHISSLPRGIFGCGTLSVLDLSHNRISTLEERICDNLFNLTEINLSSNPLECSCQLFRLVSWLQDHGVRVRRADATRCDQPSEVRDQSLLNVSLHTCGPNYAACLRDSNTGINELVIFTTSTPGNFSQEGCNAHCFSSGQRYGGLGTQRECLCSTNWEPNYISESQCSAACTDPQVMKDCGWRVAQIVFPVHFSASFHQPARTSVHTLALLSVNSSMLTSALSWDFGDSTPQVNTTQLSARHKYALPGNYTVQVQLWSSNKEIRVHQQVQVTLPALLDLRCPAFLVANESLSIQLLNWGGVGVEVNWRVLKDGNETARAMPRCPPGGLLYSHPVRCYHLVAEELVWQEARRHCTALGGDLAVVRTDAIRALIAPHVTQQRGVWLGLSDTDVPGSLRWVNGSVGTATEGGARDRATLVPGNVCVSLDSAGHVSSHPCSTMRAFVCEYKPEVPLPDARFFLIGNPAFHTQRPVSTSNASAQYLEAPAQHVEVLMFPSLGFMEEGRLSSLEFVTKNLSQKTMVCFQVYRPDCRNQGMHLLLAGSGDISAPIAMCHTEIQNSTAKTCPLWYQWCPYHVPPKCLQVGKPCLPSLCPNCSSLEDLSLEATYPDYIPKHSVNFTLDPGESRHQVIQGLKDILVFPGDFISIQHDAGAGALLLCSEDRTSPWRQTVLKFNRSSWFSTFVNITQEETWLDDQACQLRVLYTGKQEITIPGHLLQTGLPNAGTYSFEVTSLDPDFPSQATCPIQVVPPLNLTVVYPPYQNGTLYFPTNQTFLLAKVQSWHHVIAGLQGRNETFEFQTTCPEDLVSVVEECQSSSVKDQLFAFIDLPFGNSPPPTVVLIAHSNVTSTNLTVRVRVEEPLRGLNVLPNPNSRVLMASVIKYTATVEGGSDPSFKWTVDDKLHFTYYNTVFHVIYQNAAIYKLSVTALNHVSSLTEHYNVMVEKMNPMCNLTVKGVPPIVTQGSAQSLSAAITVDISVDTTIRWSFGDGGYEMYHFIPPYDSAVLFPDAKMITLNHSITYIYTQPGEYTLTVSASNQHENMSQKIDVYVYSILTKVEIVSESSPLMAQSPMIFEAHPLPSAYGIIYSWDFGDGTPSLQGRERRVSHTFSHSGIYVITVMINNTISNLTNHTKVLVSEEIVGLEAFSSAPTELHTSTLVTAHVKAGNNITWTFDMGDGELLTGLGPQLEYKYEKEGNYTVNVTASNPSGVQWITLNVQVFVLQVLWLEPSGCIQEHLNISFFAAVTGNSSLYTYEWSFGDGTPNFTIQGSPMISHIFSNSDDYHLSLLLSSGVNKAHFFTWVCVQPMITNVTLVPPSQYTKLGEESRFIVRAFPDFDYTYHWDFGTNESSTQGGNEIAFTYKNPGQYVVMVTILNNISCSNNTALVEVQESVGPVVIQHNGTKFNNLTLHQAYTFLALPHLSKIYYIWEFCDGTSATGHNVTHIFNSSGHCNVSVIGSNNVSSSKAEMALAIITPIQGLTINASLTSVPLNTSVHFEAHLHQGDNVNYSWILCDRCTAIPTSHVHTHYYTFKSIGTFNVIVTAENEISSMQASIFIYVQRELEGLQIVSEDLDDGFYFPTNKILHLQATLREGTNMSFSWSIMKENEVDQNLSGKSIDIGFLTPGLCQIFLKAHNLLGQISVNRTVEFLVPVGSLSLTIMPNPVSVQTFTNMTVSVSVGSSLDYLWFIDGVPLSWNTPSILHEFESPGLKIVTVEVFNEVSSENISEWIRVQEPVSGVSFSATNVTEQDFVVTGTSVSLLGEINTGTNVSWNWILPGQTATGQKITYFFPSAGVYRVILNATNDISWKVFTKDFTVQDKIEGLELKVNKSIVAPREYVEFTIGITSGTSVRFVLRISGDFTLELTNQTYIHQFTRVDTYVVNLTAHNQVSSERLSIMMSVMEPIRGLRIGNCCEAAIPVGVGKSFTADIQTGDHVRFLWTFDLHHGAKKSVVAKEVFYIPEEAGQLTIYLRALNPLGCQNVTYSIQVQNILTSVTLKAEPQDTFINKSVYLHASVYPWLTLSSFRWTFSDGSEMQSTTNPYISHSFSRPGSYMVKVNASNLVSWVIAEIRINIQVLECEEPEVQLVRAQRLVIRRSHNSLVEANVDLKGCVEYSVEYLWEIFDTPLCANVRGQPKTSLPADVDVRRLQLSIPKMTLKLGNYSAVFSLSYRGVPLRKSTCFQLSVVAGKLVPIIEGGNYRVWSKTQDLQLSAEQSYDPNLEPENQSLLNYLWECLSTSKGPTHCSSLNFGLGSNGPVLGIPGSELEEDVEYTFQLTISKEGMSPESTRQTVLVRSGRIPMVSLECVSCKAQSVFEVSQSSYVYLAGSCSNCHAFHNGRWTAMTLKNESLVLDGTTTTTGSNGMNLVLRQGVLRNGDSYVFSLNVTDALMDREGVASIVLRPNLPPAGGSCTLQPNVQQIQSLVDKVHFICTGYMDSDDSDTPLLYSLMVTRCSKTLCEEFCVYKGSNAEHATFLPSGLQHSSYRVDMSIFVEDNQGAAIKALNKSIEVILPQTPAGFTSLAHWLYNLTQTSLRDLLKQGDPQRIRELCLAIITVLNEYESRNPLVTTNVERRYRVNVRSNITRALTSLDLKTVSDIQQTSAALAQCTAVSREFICEECQNSTLNKLESMLEILQTDTKQGTVTPTEIADNILNITGGLIQQVSQSQPQLEAEDKLPLLTEHHPLRVAAKAYNLSSELMRILMHSRVLNEEPLVLRGTEIVTAGKRADPQSLLCYQESPSCPFSIPRAFHSSLGPEARVVQLLVQVESNPFPFNYVSNYTISTEVASMEFQTENGSQIPIDSLEEGQAITVAVANISTINRGSVRLANVSTNITSCSSVIARINTNNTNRQAGLHIQVTFTPLKDDVDGNKIREDDPSIAAYLHSINWPNEYNCTQQKRISLSMLKKKDHKPYTFFLSPLSYDTTLDYYVNVTTDCSVGSPSVQLEVAVFSSLCQYFSENDNLWRTDGMEPLADTTADRAVCSTRHLTAFAASLFVPSNSVQFIVPNIPASLNYVALLICVVAVLCYSVAATILHRLDQLELRRAAVVPLCGKDGLFKYEVQVKTGWGRGAGTTAHVGISLYGRESRSGHRHLDCSGAFARNSLDIFNIATDASLGSLWKIRVWHDNKGLDPSWHLQYVLVKDLQTGNSYYFLVKEWLSVDNERTDGRVEVEVEASTEEDLRQLPRLLTWELQRAVSDSHMWVSLWDRPMRSPFTRLQRATCCALLLHLIMLANTVWYTMVSSKARRPMPISELVSLSGENLAVGLVSCLVVYPLYLLVLCVFRMSRSKVSVEQSPSQVDQESLEIDDFLDNSMAGSSFLILHGIPGEAYSEETNLDLTTPSTKSLHTWAVAERDGTGNWPDFLSDPALAAEALPKLKRGQGSRHLGVDMVLTPEEEEAGAYAARRFFTSSDEELIKRILADRQLQFFTGPDSDLADLASIFGDKTEVIFLQKLNDPLPPAAARRDPPKPAFMSHTVATDVCRQRCFPPWCGRAALFGSWTALALASCLVVWLGLGFSQHVALMWLISSCASVLTSFLILEPLKVLAEALYFSLVVQRLRPEEQDVLVESPRMEPVSQRIHRVRPPQGFALFQAREEARKVRVLHRTLKNFLLYMLFLLGVLLMNYSDSRRLELSIQLRSQLQHRLQTTDFTSISSRDDAWMWLSESLLPYINNNLTLLDETGNLLLGSLRLRQIRAPLICSTVGDCAVESGNQGWSDLGSGLAQNWSGMSAESAWVWHWGIASVYSSGGYVQELGRSLEESVAVVQHLKEHGWLDHLSQALFVEFSLYNTNTDLLAVVTFLLELPTARGALGSLDLKTCSLQRLSSGVDLLLLLTVCLLGLVVYFLVRESVRVCREGRGYFLRPWNVAGVSSLVLSLATGTLHLNRAALADRLWGSYLHQRHAFTYFYPLAFQSQVFTQLSALLLFLLVLKASHQLRFLREWAVFGHTLQRSARELLAGGSVLLVMLIAYSQAGYLLFHSAPQGFSSVGAACLSLMQWGLGRGGCRLNGSFMGLLYQGSFGLLQLAVLWLLVVALLRNYRLARADLYRPAVELQDYEMVDLFLRRLKMWMGLSRAKEFRHKVHFEGMELPPSRSSSTSDCKSLCLPPLDTPDAPPTPDSVDAGSEASWRPASSSPCSLGDGMAGGGVWREPGEVDLALRRLLPAFDSLLLQLERVVQATEELYHTECLLERLQRRGRDGMKERVQRDSAGRRSHRTQKSHPGTHSHKHNQPPIPDPVAASSRRNHWDEPAHAEVIQPSSLFRHPAHTTTIPKRKRKRTPLKNKVHPNTDVHVSSHPKP